MYDTACFIQYDTSEAYQSALLTAFRVSSPDDLCACIDVVYASAPGLGRLVAALAEKNVVPLSMAHLFLFSYDYFAATHAYLCGLSRGVDDVTELEKIIG